ncbi:hypothetical protein Daus18300_009365 [Diaporthe australafricana]|uniref:Uncharacterized protein n=1 Tax=Diaporthe australafricana TaxID=127596 RepID=A0ABR3WE84_9PEZI
MDQGIKQRSQELILRALTDVVSSNKDKVARMHAFKGGWEAWLQVELTLALQDDLRGKQGLLQHTHTREDTAYHDSAQRVDVLVTSEIPGGQSKWTNTIELKCESKFNRGFAGSVVGDYNKVSKGDIKPEYLPCAAWVVAVSVTAGAETAMDQKVGEMEEIDMKKHVISAVNDPGRVVVWHGFKEFNA